MRRRNATLVLVVAAAIVVSLVGSVTWVVYAWNADHSERLCARGEVPVWHTENVSGTDCAAPQGPVPAGYAFYPPGRAPVWSVPPDDYEHLTDDLRDAYDVHPNSPEYPYLRELYAAYPRTECPSSGAETLDVVGVEPVGAGGPMVHIEVWASLNRAGDLCLDIMRGHADPGADMVSFELEARQTGVVWTQDGPDISDVAPLRVGTRGCVRFTAEVTMAGAGEGTYDYRAHGRAGNRCRA